MNRMMIQSTDGFVNLGFILCVLFISFAARLFMPPSQSLHSSSSDNVDIEQRLRKYRELLRSMSDLSLSSSSKPTSRLRSKSSSVLTTVDKSRTKCATSRAKSVTKKKPVSVPILEVSGVSIFRNKMMNTSRSSSSRSSEVSALPKLEPLMLSSRKRLSPRPKLKQNHMKAESKGEAFSPLFVAVEEEGESMQSSELITVNSLLRQVLLDQ